MNHTRHKRRYKTFVNFCAFCGSKKTNLQKLKTRTQRPSTLIQNKNRFIIKCNKN